MLMQVLVHCPRASRDLSVLGQCFELAPFGMVGPHVLVLLFLLIWHLLATACTVDEPGLFDLEPPGAVRQELWLLFLQLLKAAWPWECSRAVLLLYWLYWRAICLGLPILVPVGDIEEVINDTLLQLSPHCHVRSSLELVPILR